ncbi:hypothetical protein BLNAU_12234 [Blattamonas nauphoetae]|uniref:Uncharacterized protein n=1 Tax=Blattamonas nauphoetae TaxID=2049346 RepID=A0ABQ9XR08_9EUKA|nr:hypothetical protein BLNAU_12234 [Blattamonas nauphoetae]
MVNCCYDDPYPRKCCICCFKFVNIIYVLLGITLIALSIVAGKVVYKLLPYSVVFVVLCVILTVVSIYGMFGSGYIKSRFEEDDLTVIDRDEDDSEEENEEDEDDEDPFMYKQTVKPKLPKTSNSHKFLVKPYKLIFLTPYFYILLLTTISSIIVSFPIMFSSARFDSEMTRLNQIFNDNKSSVPSFMNLFISMLLSLTKLQWGLFIIGIGAVFIPGILFLMALLTCHKSVQLFNGLASLLLALSGIIAFVFSIIGFNQFVLIRSYFTLFILLLLVSLLMFVFGLWGMISAIIVRKSTKPSCVNAILIGLLLAVFFAIIIFAFFFSDTLSELCATFIASGCGVAGNQPFSAGSCGNVTKELMTQLCTNGTLPNCHKALLDRDPNKNGTTCSCDILVSASIIESVNQMIESILQVFLQNMDWTLTVIISIFVFYLIHLFSLIIQGTCLRLKVDDDGS